MDLLGIYGGACPACVADAMAAPEMARLAGVGMNCGCEYTAFPLFDFPVKGYSRLAHSEGVARIVWRFTGDTRQAMAGLLHDVATPAFAHAIDFLNGDYDRQESTEAGAAAAIESSGAIQAALKRCGLTTGDVCDDRLYPIANNPTPGLSADRLEYTLGLAWRRGIAALPEIERLYRDLSVARNERGEDELAFGSADAAVRFARLALENARMFTADEDRFSMRYLADLLRWALDARVLAPGDLRRTEARLIDALIAHPEGRARWRAFTRLRHVRRADRPGEGYWVKVPAKKRYVDPLVRGKGRASRLSGDLRARISEFQALRFDAWLSGE